MLSKNFKYGDLWTDDLDLSGPRKRRQIINPKKLTSNSEFLKFLDEGGFTVYLDYETSEAAYTLPQQKIVVLNGHFNDTELGSFLQHELGHLMIFDAPQFVSGTASRPATLRSLICDVLYTPENMRKYGIEQLLWGENVAQDVVIETVSNKKCVCSVILRERGVNSGVKHLESLESLPQITREIVSNALVPQDSQFSPKNAAKIAALLDNMLNELDEDIAHLEEENRKIEAKDHVAEAKSRTLGKTRNLKSKLNKAKARNPNPTPRQKRSMDSLQSKIDELESPEQEARDEKTARDEYERAKARNAKKAKKREELREAFEEARAEAQAEADRQEAEGQGESSEGEADQESGNPSGPDGKLHSNTTDHEGGDDEESGEGHSFDCGFPAPTTINRQSPGASGRVVSINSTSGVKPITIDLDSVVNTDGGHTKSDESETTYLKSAKREFDMTDMMKGKRRKRVSGINVLVGLDISGSMSSNWAVRSRELEKLVLDLKKRLDIEELVVFTYNHALHEHGTSFSDLSLTAKGGNAFGYVYQQILSTLPVRAKNEIILVTDCGDNLGFKLSKAAVATTGSEEIVNHITVVDTDNFGFYNLEQFQEEEWDLIRSDDPDLPRRVRGNIERLIEG